MTAPQAFWDRVGPEIGWIHRQLRRLGVREPDLEDVTQEVLVALHRRWNDYDAARPLRSWLFGFVFRLASEYRRRAVHRRETAALDPDLVDGAPDAVAQLEAASRRALLLAALDRLDLDKRAILTLVDLEELSVPEAVAVLEIPLNTGYSRLRAARAELAEGVRSLQQRSHE
jgi:RNA polymerase sigma-70 factor (ECF subfamily)